MLTVNKHKKIDQVVLLSAHGGVVAFKVDPIETRSNYWVIIFQSLLSGSKFGIEIKVLNYLT